MGKYELLGFHHEIPDRSPTLDFARVAFLLVSAGAFVLGEWLLGIGVLFLAVVSGHGLPHEVTHFDPGRGGVRW